MKNRVVSVLMLLVLLVTLTATAQASPVISGDQPALVYVQISAADDMTRFASTGLDLFAMLDGGLLTGADQAGQDDLKAAGLTYQVIDSNLASGSYYQATVRSNRPNPDYAAYGQVLLDSSSSVLLRLSPQKVAALTQAGAELRKITLTPKPLPASDSTQVFPAVIEPDPIIQGMIDQVTETQVYTYDRQLAGELPVWVDGVWSTITSRYTYSNTPIQLATKFVGQHMANDLGLGVENYVWNNATNPDVIGEIPGQVNPDDIFIIGAHLDDVSGVPGADDNGSGSVATLIAADILSQYQWGCTLRFAFWTGEEQGLLGSSAYAQHAYSSGENIIGYLNLDMIAWNTVGSDPYITLAYSTAISESQQLAHLFADVLPAYNINLLPDYAPDMWGSDHNSFWDYGFTSILAIEDDLHGDFNPYYHSPADTPAHTDPAYFTDFVKASIATYAHMSGCLIPTENGNLDGHVTSAGDASPIAGAAVTAENSLGDTYPYTTDPSGYYTITLPADTYTVTVAADGYQSSVMSGVEVVAGNTTTLDFSLQPACEPVSGLDFSWLPLEPYNGEVVTFTATASGTQPIDFQWDFGDTVSATGETVNHFYLSPNIYTVALSATNACGSAEVEHDITVGQITHHFFLPLLNRQ
jgi:hypothetical protein